jgi:hypothetical protein
MGHSSRAAFAATSSSPQFRRSPVRNQLPVAGITSMGPKRSKGQTHASHPTSKAVSRRIHLNASDGRRRCRLDYADADHAIADGCCPTCHAVPFRVQGTGRRIAADDRAYEAGAVCLACAQIVGTLRVEVNTLFGLREDEAVFRSGVKIY